MNCGTVKGEGTSVPPVAPQVTTPDAPVLAYMGNELKARIKQLELEQTALSEQNAALLKELTQLKGDFSVLSGKFDDLTKVVNEHLSKPTPTEEHPFPRIHQPTIPYKRKFDETVDKHSMREPVSGSPKVEATKTVDELLAKGERLRDAHKYHDAFKLYREVHKRDRDNVEAIYGLAACYLGLEDYEKAKDWLNRLFKKEKTHLRARLALGECYSQQEKFAEAQECIETACKEHPTRSVPWIHLGNLMQQQGKPEKAMESYRQALELNKGNADAYVRMMDCFMADNNVDAAKALLEKGLNDNPHSRTLKAKLSELKSSSTILINNS